MGQRLVLKNRQELMVEELAQKGVEIEKQVGCYRKVRDEIKIFVGGLPDNLKEEGRRRG